MPRARDFLERFRPIGTAGAAAPAGVPADRLADATRELRPVFESLEDVGVECARIRDAATAEALRRRNDAAAQAAAIVAAARRDAPGRRADAAARLRGQSAADVASVVEQGEREAEALTERAQRRMDGYVERVLAAVRQSLSGERIGERVP